MCVCMCVENWMDPLYFEARRSANVVEKCKLLNADLSLPKKEIDRGREGKERERERERGGESERMR